MITSWHGDAFRITKPLCGDHLRILYIEGQIFRNLGKYTSNIKICTVSADAHPQSGWWQISRLPWASYHVPWCMSGSLTRGGKENVPGLPGACATRNFTYLVIGPYIRVRHLNKYTICWSPSWLYVGRFCLNVLHYRLYVNSIWTIIWRDEKCWRMMVIGCTSDFLSFMCFIC